MDVSTALSGGTLQCVHALEWDVSSEPGPIVREAYALQFGKQAVVLAALNDTSEVQLTVGSMVVPSDNRGGEYRIVEVSASSIFTQFLGKSAMSWWWLRNEFGYSDGFMIAFTRTSGACFVAMNDQLSVLHIQGEQLA